MSGGEFLNPHDHDRGIANEEKLNAIAERIAGIEALIKLNWTAHDRVHLLEKEARELALAALQAQTRLVFGILGLIVGLLAAGAALVVTR